MLGDLAVSPDGETIAFEFSLPFVGRGGPTRTTGLGLYAWRTGGLERVPNPAGRQLGAPSFDPDGRRLVCLHANRGARAWFGVSAVALPGFERRDLVPEVPPLGGAVDTNIRSNVVVRPGSGELLLGRASYATNVELLLLATGGGEPRVVLPQEASPRYVDRLAFAGPGEVLFQGLSAKAPALEAQLAAIGLPWTATAIWRLRLGGSPGGARPELFFPRTRAEALPPGVDAASGGAGGVAAARGGTLVLTVARSRDRPTGPRGEFYYEVFRVGPDGAAAPLTRIWGVPNRVAVAEDGTVAAFLEDPARTRRPDGYDLWTLDLRTGAAAPTGLLGRIAASTAFAEP